jgi:hypothetical protein
VCGSGATAPHSACDRSHPTRAARGSRVDGRATPRDVGATPAMFTDSRRPAVHPHSGHVASCRAHAGREGDRVRARRRLDAVQAGQPQAPRPAAAQWERLSAHVDRVDAPALRRHRRPRVAFEGSHQPRPLADNARDFLTGRFALNPVPYKPPDELRVLPPVERDATRRSGSSCRGHSRRTGVPSRLSSPASRRRRTAPSSCSSPRCCARA